MCMWCPGPLIMVTVVNLVKLIGFLYHTISSYLLSTYSQIAISLLIVSFKFVLFCEIFKMISVLIRYI